MGDHRAGTSGSTATDVNPSTAPTGKRVARHCEERRTSHPYVGRRVAAVSPEPGPIAAPPSGESLSYTGRRVAGRDHVAGGGVRVVAPRISLGPELTSDPDDVVGHLLRPTGAPSLETYVGRRVATPTIVIEPVVVEPVLVAPVLVAPVIEPAEIEPVEIEPVEIEPAVEVRTPEPVPAPRAENPRPTRQAGRRAAARRTRIPSLPLLAGVAVLAISAGGTLQAMHPGLAGADTAGRISPAGALSGSSAVGSASLLGGRTAVVSRDSNRTLSGGNLQAVADAQAKQRDAALSASLQQAEKQAAQIKLHQWVLPITPGVYHLTARFGDYSSLWSHFHTGLDFAAPTGTPIMAVAGGTITETAYSGAYGNRTIEALPDGTELWYCHQNEFGTSVGATVKPGQVIGYVGSTGNVTGPHLHLEVHPGGGDPVDPYAALVAHGLYPGPPS